MTVRDFLSVMRESDNLLIVQDAANEREQEIIYRGYKALLSYFHAVETVMDDQVKGFQVLPEIYHKQWKDRGLMPPMEPEKTADFRFSDLQMILYYKITI
ncbi:MAG: hypothetical protein K2L07_15825 [Lachnospiraceae bacterium]|nr:hypothetical protein [Lachnospiraceae bacterium]